MNANMAGSVYGLSWFAGCCGVSNEWKGKALFCFGEELVDAPPVDEVFESSLLAIGAIAVLGKDPDHCCGHGYGLVGTQQKAAIGSKLAVPGYAAEQCAK